MSRIFTPVLALGIAFMMSTAVVSASDEPSSGAKGMPGAAGTFEFKPTDWMEGTTSWWKDSDGIDPGEPGCHIGTDEKGEPNGRTFGEACRTGCWWSPTRVPTNCTATRMTSAIPISSTATRGVSGRVLPRVPVLRQPRHPVSSPRCASASDLFGAPEALGFSGLDAENRARLYLHYEMTVPAMVAGPSPERDKQLLIERHRFLTAARVE